MKVIKKENDIIQEVDYPRENISEPVYKLDKSIQYYFIQENKIENPEPDKYNVVWLQDELTEIIHPVYSHLKICNRNYELQEKGESEILNRLNDSLGNHLDNSYPLYKRTKHAVEALKFVSKGLEKISIDEQSRLSYLEKLDKWVSDCRTERDLRENNYIKNQIFPSFEWEQFPII